MKSFGVLFLLLLAGIVHFALAIAGRRLKRAGVTVRPVRRLFTARRRPISL